MKRLLALCALFLTLWTIVGHAATGTIMPTPFQTLLDANGKVVNNGKVCTYLAGTSTLTATYTDVALSVANANPIRTDSAGRFTAYLSPGVSYKFVYQDSTGTAGNCDGASIKTVDNISSVPTSGNNLDLVGTAGEALTAGQAVYLSDGSGSKNAGQWYKADNTQAYSSVVPEVGIVPASISSGASGTIRIAGSATGLSSLTIGNAYYIGTAGGVTLTAPGQRRFLGVADTTSTLVLTPNPASAIVLPWVNDFRLTLTTAVPITTSDVTAATTIYASSLTANRIDLPDSNGNPVRLVCAEFSIAVPATTSQMYDIWAYNNAGACALELLSWTNDTTRATAIVRTNGRYMKTGDSTRLYVGSFRTTTVSGQTEDSAAKRYVWNYYNRMPRVAQKSDATASWTYTTATWRQANAGAANQIDIVQGVAESPLTLQLNVVAGSTSGGGGGVAINFAIGEDSTTTPLANAVGYINIFTASTITTATGPLLTRVPAVGRHFYAWMEASAAAGTTTWYGTNNSVGGVTTACGLFGTWWS